MIKLNNALVFGSLVLTSFGLSSSAMADGDQHQQGDSLPISAMIEIAGGYEKQAVDMYSPCVGKCGGSNEAVDESRGGPMLRFAFKGISASELMSNNIGGYHMSFIPISMIVDVGGGAPDNFGRVTGHEGRSGRVRQLLGALVQASYSPGSGILALRGKLVRVEYNRDKGYWDWRAIDASVGVQGAVHLTGNTTLNIALDVGGGIGGIHLNGMEELSKALDIAPTLSGAATLNPYAALRTGLYSPSLKVELIGTAERRVDLTREAKESEFHGRELSVDSTHLIGTAEVEFIFGRAGLKQMGRRFSIFADATYDFDTLTLSNTLFGSNDGFRSFMVFAGLRLQF